MKTLKLTFVLRWKKEHDPIADILRKDSYVLQQAWQVIETGEVVWQDVPRAEE